MSPLSVGVLPGESRDDAASADPPPGDGPDGVAGSWPPSSSLSVTTLMVPSLETSDDAWLIIDARFASFRRNCCIAGLNLHQRTRRALQRVATPPPQTTVAFCRTSVVAL